MTEVDRLVVAAQRAGEDRLDKCWTIVFDDADVPEACGLFCGCTTCVVREVLDAAIPFLFAVVRKDPSVLDRVRVIEEVRQ